MSTINDPLKILIGLAKVQALVARRFDRLTIHGISFSDFVILSLLYQSADGKMRRIDLADKIGLTASAITRILLPMEKTGWVTRLANERDARVSYVVLTAAGRQLFEDAEKTANEIALEIINPKKIKNIKPLADLLTDLGGSML